MKRLIAILLLFLMLPCMYACTQEEEIIFPVTYHYLRAPLPNGELSHGDADSVIAADIREGDGHQGDYTYLLDIYLQGPLDRDFRSPYPAGTVLKEFALDGGIAVLLLSDEFGELTGIDLTLACGCLALTVMDMTGAKSVTIRADGMLLDGRESITMDRSSILLTDDTIPETN